MNLNFVLNVKFYLMINLKNMVLLSLILKFLEYQNLNILLLHKQQYLCKHCNKAFTVSTSIVSYACHIFNNTKEKIVVDLTKKSSEKDIAEDNDLSSNTVEKVIDSYYDTIKLFKN